MRNGLYLSDCINQPSSRDLSNLKSYGESARSYEIPICCPPLLAVASTCAPFDCKKLLVGGEATDVGQRSTFVSCSILSSAERRISNNSESCTGLGGRPYLTIGTPTNSLSACGRSPVLVGVPP